MRRKSRRTYRKYNPWAICHAQGLKKGTRKFESCVLKVKKKMKRRGRWGWRGAKRKPKGPWWVDDF